MLYIKQEMSMTHEDMQIVEADDEINIWELVDYLKSGWRWLSGGFAIGLLGAIGFLILVPAKYEATAVIQPATIGTVATTTTTTTTTTTVETVAQTIERLKLVTFYGDELVKTCQATSAKDLAEDVKASLVKGNALLSIGYRANSVETAESCVAKIVGQLAQTQSKMAAPLIKELEDQLASTKQQIEEEERFLAQNEKLLSPAANGAVLLMLKREELTNMKKLYREQRLQLIEPLTRSLQLLEPVYAPQKAVSPKKLLIVVGGLIGGLFAGLLALFINRSWRRYKSKSV
jgi:LPS O-antigen subunit length determinant protein (WzzB/FepE family)